jgi:hypothetical protein
MRLIEKKLNNQLQSQIKALTLFKTHSARSSEKKIFIALKK